MDTLFVRFDRIWRRIGIYVLNWIIVTYGVPYVISVS